MRARAAYIRSLGTTSILVAAALLMLAMVGAIVGFHGWPQGAVREAVPSVPLKPAPQPVLSAVRYTPEASSGTRAGLATRRSASATGLVKVESVRSPQAIGYPVAVPPGETSPTSGAPAQGPAADGNDPSSTGQPSPSQPADPGQIQTFVNQLLGSSPPPPGPQPGQSTEVSVPVVGTTVTVPPAPSQ